MHICLLIQVLAKKPTNDGKLCWPFVYHIDTCSCMFKQFLTRNDWWVIPLIWFPVVCWFETMSFRMGHDLPQIALMIVTGIFIWTLMEYTLHRFLFHIHTKSYWSLSLFFLCLISEEICFVILHSYSYYILLIIHLICYCLNIVYT